MFAYCNNNPVVFVDTGGYSAKRENMLLDGCSRACFLLLSCYILLGAFKQESQTVPGRYVLPLKVFVQVITPASSKNQKNDKKESGNGKSLKTTGEPNSTEKLYDDDGNLKQERYYDENGKAKYDIDYDHGGSNHKFPHVHPWDWTQNPTRLPSIPYNEFFLVYHNN